MYFFKCTFYDGVFLFERNPTYIITHVYLMSSHEVSNASFEHLKACWSRGFHKA